MIVQRLYNGHFYMALDGWTYDAPSYPGESTVEAGEGYWFDGLDYGAKLTVNDMHHHVSMYQSVDLSYVDYIRFDLHMDFVNYDVFAGFDFIIDYFHRAHVSGPGPITYPFSFYVGDLSGVRQIELRATAPYSGSTTLNITRGTADALIPPPTFYPRMQTMIGPV